MNEKWQALPLKDQLLAAIIQLFITALAWSDMATVMISYECITNIFEFKFSFLVDVVP